MDLDSKEFADEMRKCCALFELGYRVEQLKLVVAEELRLEQIVEFFNGIIIKVKGIRCH